MLPNGAPIPTGKTGKTKASAADDAPGSTSSDLYVPYEPAVHGRVTQRLLDDIAAEKFKLPPDLSVADARALVTQELSRRLNKSFTKPVDPAPLPRLVDDAFDIIEREVKKGREPQEAIKLAREALNFSVAPVAAGAIGLASDPAPEDDIERSHGGPVETPAVEPKVYLKTRNKTGNWQIRSTDGKYASGGAISRAVSTARSYATGGAVHVGPVVGATGGRADKLPVAVSEGAFVVPADIVSGLGEGNTLAGMDVLKKTFGMPSKSAGGGSAVPIKISDGEFVLSPDQVAKIGHGDVSRGHQILDEMIRKLRLKHIETLSSLPPPAK